MAKKRKKRAANRSKRTAKKNSKQICFTIMPFGNWLDDYYASIYCPAIVAAGLQPHRADDLFRPSTIVNDIWAYTKKAKVLLADLTGKNANVFYELGLAHALAKPAILIAESMDDIPFDLRALRIIIYDKNAPDWGQILKTKIETSLKEVLTSPIEAVLPAFLDIKSAGAKPTVSADKKDLIEIKQELDLVRRELRSGEKSIPRSEVISPGEARSMMEGMIRRNVPEPIIYERLVGLGPPREWITEQIALLKSKRRAIQARRARFLKKQSLQKKGS